MAALRDIRKRIRSVKSSRKITAAMKMVAASKLRRAQEAIVAARPYANELGALLRRVASRATDESGAAPHPLLEVRPLRKALLVVMTSDRGLCGAFNSNILRRAERFLHEHRERFEALEIATIGRRGRDYFGKRRLHTVRDFAGVFDDLTYRRATEVAEGVADEYVRADLDSVFLLYNEFKSAISQRVVVVDLLPVVKEELPAGEDVDYEYEPNQVAVLERLVPRYLATLVWRALLESSAAEHGARMTAMDAATRNAKDLVDRLTLQYNRARQATITKELMEIVGGAEALKG
ncbi:MAG: ATP synthase F1 subunit gamma [Deltaproteobacteria bacterium]|nr:ATP synthase F1 subunit gamma [Deltaproteobacteria bacterium]